MVRRLMPIDVDIPVAWGDMDAYGHVNNTVFLRWCESGRIVFFDHIGLEQSHKETGLGGILASIQCRYRAPVVYPDTISVSMTIQKLSDNDFELKYLIWSKTQLKAVAEASDRIVAYDYHKLEKSRWPEAVLYKLKELNFEQHWVEDED